MGKLISIEPKKLKPSQDYLKENTVKFILTCFYENREELLPPVPIVRHDTENDVFIAIDGHNLIAIYDLFDKNIDVYVADSAEDELLEKIFTESSREGLESRKLELKEKYESVLYEYKKLKRVDINSFSDLRNKYSYLNNELVAREFYKQHRKEYINNYLHNITMW